MSRTKDEVLRFLVGMILFYCMLAFVVAVVWLFMVAVQTL